MFFSGSKMFYALSMVAAAAAVQSFCKRDQKTGSLATPSIESDGHSDSLATPGIGSDRHSDSFATPGIRSDCHSTSGEIGTRAATSAYKPPTKLRPYMSEFGKTYDEYGFPIDLSWKARASNCFCNLWNIRSIVKKMWRARQKRIRLQSEQKGIREHWAEVVPALKETTSKNKGLFDQEKTTLNTLISKHGIPEDYGNVKYKTLVWDTVIRILTTIPPGKTVSELKQRIPDGFQGLNSERQPYISIIDQQLLDVALPVLCRYGIPMKYRRIVWPYLLGAKDKMLENLDQFLPDNVPEGHGLSAIKGDVPRIFDHQSPNATRLQRVLRAYASDKPYVQGMGNVAAQFVIIFQDEPEETGVKLSYWCFYQFLQDPRFDMQGIYEHDFLTLMKRDAVFVNNAIKVLMPKSGFANLDPDGVIVLKQSFFNKLFTDIPSSAYLVLWDAMLGMTNRFGSEEKLVQRELVIRLVTALFVRLDHHFRPGSHWDVNDFAERIFGREIFDPWSKKQTDGQALIEEGLAFDATIFNNFEIPAAQVQTV